MKRNISHGFLYAFSALATLSISVAVLMENYSQTIDSALGTHSTVIKAESGEGTESLYSAFKPSEDVLNKDGSGNSKALIQKAFDLDRKVAAEGCVLLKNENNSLPLAAGKKVTLFGIRSKYPLLGSNMGNPVYGGMLNLESALGTDNQTHWEKSSNRYSGGDKNWTNFTFDGGNLVINPTMSEAYELVKANRTGGVTPSYNENMSKPYNSTEATLLELEGAKSGFKSSFASYNDAAIVVVGRPGTEGMDYLPGSKGCASGSGATDPLGLTDTERDTIKLATDNFSNVVVLVNTTNQMEIDELKNNPKISSILYIGFPGAYGCLGVSDVITGKANPSGGANDIFVAANRSMPAAVNFGEYTFSNASSIARGKRSNHYVIESEGIYTGYRYYETRYEDCVLDRFEANSTKGAVASSGNWTYSQEVSYPFGYGLSYTTFERTLKGEPEIEYNVDTHVATMEFTVNIKNTGSVDGKATAEIYGQAPYEQYGIEKASVQLLGFEKSDVIKAGQEVDLKVKVDLQNLVSYDSNAVNPDGTKGTYVFESGDYYFTVANGSHDAINNILAKKGYTPALTSNRMDAEGNENACYKMNSSKAEALTNDFFSHSKTGQRISNQIPYADWNYYEDNAITHLSRSRWASTYPVEYTNLTAPNSMLDDLEGKYYTVKTDETPETVWDSEETNYKFYELFGASYDDPRLDQLASQMSLEEGMYFSLFGGPVFPSVESVGFQEAFLLENSGNGVVLKLKETKDTNAPWAIKDDDEYSLWSGQILPAAPLVASTFSHEVMEEVGEFMGIESLFTGISIIWGPGLNTHRTPYCGRNNEYYSEDPVLSGECALEASYGAQKYGCILAAKHFAFNDLETNRKGVAPFMTEQRAREIELRAYQIAVESSKYDKYDESGKIVEDTGLRGLMTSFSKIGGVECSCSRGMLTDILRNEWGFHGYAVTDIEDDMDLASQELYAGITGVDIRGAQSYYTTTTIDGKFANQVDGTTMNKDAYKGDATMQATIRESNKGLLWVFSQSNLVNRYNSTTRTVWNFTWWRGAYMGAIGATAGAAITFAVLYALKTVGKKGGSENE